MEAEGSRCRSARGRSGAERCKNAPTPPPTHVRMRFSARAVPTKAARDARVPQRLVQRRSATEKERWVAAALREPSARASGAWLSVGTWPAAAGCRRLPSLAVLQKRGGMSAHSQQQPGHICCCSSSSARRVWPPAASDGSSRMSDSDGASEPTSAPTSKLIVADFTIPMPSSVHA